MTRDRLSHLGGDPHFTPPRPTVPAGHVDNQGVMITKEDWATWDQQSKGDWT